jgi:hypothetical protein
MIPPMALEANGWWVPREPLLREEVPPPPVKRSPRALAIPSEREAGRSRPARAMVALMALETDCWSVPREPLRHGELPSPAQTPLQAPWAEARQEAQLPRLVQFRPGSTVAAAAKLRPAELPQVQSL